MKLNLKSGAYQQVRHMARRIVFRAILPITAGIMLLSCENETGFKKTCAEFEIDWCNNSGCTNIIRYKECGNGTYLRLYLEYKMNSRISKIKMPIEYLCLKRLQNRKNRVDFIVLNTSIYISRYTTNEDGGSVELERKEVLEEHKKIFLSELCKK
ncbi:MAG: hypothetical protein WC501_03850 [Candidatus Micrarchaeia archaeon]